MPTAATSPKTLLIVDDDPTVRTMLRATFAAENVTIIEAGDFGQGYLLAEQYHPDVVLLDILLPDGDGLELCAQLRAAPATTKSAVVMLTARRESSDERDAELAGAVGLLRKPFSPRRLLDLVDELLTPKSTSVDSLGRLSSTH